MTEQKSKAELVEMRRALYAHFDALIVGLSEQQIQMPGVNGDWSVKDHLAHLTFWERVYATTQSASSETASGVEQV